MPPNLVKTGFGSHDAMPPDNVVFGCSQAMRSLRDKLHRVAATNIPVLICGESGTGKELFAKLVHRLSPWRNGPFVKVNCAAIPGTLLESELFGHEKGAFTGAYAAKPGRVELAAGGTLFLDEIGELENALQAKLLHLLQDGTFTRIGGRSEMKVSVRVVCATNRELEDEIRAGAFRADLFFRINGMAFRLPPLRERADDIPILARYLLARFNEKLHTSTTPMSPALLRRMRQYRWPGNIRELENFVRRYAILGEEEDMLAQLDSTLTKSFYFELPTDGNVPLKQLTQQAVREIESNIIRRVLALNNWNRKRTAQILDISYRALLYKLRDLSIPPVRTLKAKAAIANAGTVTSDGTGTEHVATEAEM